MFPSRKIKGFAFQDEKTKRLVERLRKNNIAVIEHQDIDVAAAQMLISCGVKAVINLKTSMSGQFIHNGVETLLKAKIPVFDSESEINLDLEGRLVYINDHILFYDVDGVWQKLCNVKQYQFSDVKKLKEKAKLAFPDQFRAFVENSFYYGEKELDPFVQEVKKLTTLREFLDKEVLVVARGADYEHDLLALKSMARQKKFIIIAVDGGADGLLKVGMKPDYIIGDMDSVSLKALKCGAKLLVHTYRDGRAPGETRVASTQIPYERLSFLGTSEDVAIIYAYCSGASKIYTIGTRIGMNEFLEKGRVGMGSSLLTRMKVGHVLIDLKGINTLVELNQDKRFVRGLMLFPAAIVFFILNNNHKFEFFVSLVLQWWSGR